MGLLCGDWGREGGARSDRHQMRWLADAAYPEAERVRVVLDNPVSSTGQALNTHRPACLYEAFEPKEARRVIQRLEFHYTPKHGSWLNMAEKEAARLQMFFGRDIDDLRRTWQPGQIYELRLVEDPRSDRTPQPLNPPMYLRINEEVARLVPDNPWLARYTFLEWIAPQGRDDLPPPVDSYKVQWKQTSSSWDTDADVSETITGPGHRRYHSYDLDGLTPGVEYNIRVIATDSVGDSEPSNEITYSLPAAAQQSLSNTPAEGEPLRGC